MTVDDPLAAHLFSQIEQNVHILASQNYLSQADADEILSRLSQGSSAHQGEKTPSAMANLSSKFSKLVTPSGGRAVPPPPPPVSSSGPKLQQAKALWGYNENNEVRLELFMSLLVLN